MDFDGFHRGCMGRGVIKVVNKVAASDDPSEVYFSLGTF